MTDDSFPIFFLQKVSAYEYARVSEHSHLVKLDVRSVAEIAIQNKELEAAIKVVKREGLRFIFFDRGDTHKSFFIFKYPHLEIVIRSLETKDFDNKVFGIWCYGKMFGYSEVSEKWRNETKEVTISGAITSR